jgi:hypothetical protein
MKFPTKKSYENLNNKGTPALIQKEQKKKSLSKPLNGLNSSISVNKSIKKSHPSSGPSQKGYKINSNIQE